MANILDIGYQCLYHIKSQSWFPYKTGNLKYNATIGRQYDSNTFVIHFDSTIAPYIASLEEGSSPHDIPNAFGKGREFGIGGRFDGKFHSGSNKHKGFISDKSVKAIVSYICNNYGGNLYDIS